MTTVKRPRGRPRIGIEPLTSTERNRRRRNALADAGARTVTAVLAPDAAAALDLLRADGSSIDAAIGAAILEASKRAHKRSLRVLAGTPLVRSR